MTRLTVRADKLIPGDRILDSSILQHLASNSLTVKHVAVESVGGGHDCQIVFNEPVKGDFGSYFMCVSWREVDIERDGAQQEVETYEIPDNRMNHLRSKVKRYERRAAKLGLEPFALVEGDPVKRPVHRNNDEQLEIIGYRLVVPVQLIGNAPVLAGWEFVAKIEHHGEAGNIISCAPSYHDQSVVPNEMRDGKPTCDHCHTSRRRNETFVVRHTETNELKRVGRSCLKDFCGTKHAAGAVAIWSLIAEIELASDFDSDWDDCSSWAIYPETEHYIACAFRAVRMFGWIGSKGSFGRLSATKEDAAYAATPLSPLVESERDKAAWREAQPLEIDKREAAEAIAWAKSLDGSNDYQHNLKVAVSIDYADRKRYGLLASLVVAYRRHLEQEVERKRIKKIGEGSRHFGKVRRRYIRKVTLQKYFQWEDNYFQLRCVHTFKDQDGNLLKWFGYPREIHLPIPDPDPGLNDQQKKYYELTAKAKELKIGDECWLSFQVKRHGEYKEVEDTTIYRCRPCVGPEVYKWVADDGEIFKTKKEMVAA